MTQLSMLTATCVRKDARSTCIMIDGWSFTSTLKKDARFSFDIESHTYAGFVSHTLLKATLIDRSNNLELDFNDCIPRSHGC